MNSICTQELKCHSDNDCEYNERCITNSIGQTECVEACSGYVCGRNAECAAQDHQPTCHCKPGHHGDANDEKTGCQYVECEADHQCSNDKLCDGYMCKIACLIKNPCGKNALCSAENHQQICYCQPGYTGDAYQSCRLIDFCADAPCGPGAECHNSRGSFRCLCPSGSVGDPYNEGCRAAVECTYDNDCPYAAECVTSDGTPKCRDVCQHTICGPNSECVAINHAGHCTCRNGYEGDANDITVGCRPKPVACHSTIDCPANTYCYAETCKRKLYNFFI